MELQFKNIEIEDIDIMMPFYGLRRNRTCDSVFLESFIWKEFYKVRYAIWDDKALLWLMEYNGNFFSAMPLCKDTDLADAFKALERYFNEELKVPLVINLADEFAVQYLNLPETDYFIEEQVDSKDYLYLGDALRTLSGKKLHKKKNHLNSFMRTYGDRAEYRALCCSDSHLVWQFLDRWHLAKGDEVDEHLEYEVRGIHDILKNCSNLNIRMGGVFIDEELQAFSMGSYNDIENMAIIHIEKANSDIRGLYQYINQQFLLEEFPQVEWVNREDDLGIEGLRAAKMSYCPADFARKYLVQQIVDGKHNYKWAEEIGNTMAGEEIVVLTEIEAIETKNLWHNSFPEDSENFMNYYYSEKTKDNCIYIKKQNGFLVAMAQMNPYQVKMREQDWDINYIVGVATDISHRHEGHMRDLLNRMANDLYQQGAPFTFLMPAAKEIYLPFSFSYMADMPVFSLKASAAETLIRVECQDNEEDCEKAAHYMENWLEGRFELFCNRDAAYVSRLLKELASENGQLYFLHHGDALVGLQAFWGFGKKEQRLLYADSDFIEETQKKPVIMARIICLTEILSAFALKQKSYQEEVCIYLQVRDQMISENNGVFVWTLTKSGSKVERVSANILDMPEKVGEPLVAVASVEDGKATTEETEELGLHADIQDLASWLFGGKTAGELWPKLGNARQMKLASVNTVSHIYIDEIV